MRAALAGWPLSAVATPSTRSRRRSSCKRPGRSLLAAGTRDLLATTDALAAFDRPALIAWASEDRLMPPEHGRRLAELLPQGRLVEIADCYTLIPEDQPATLAEHMREFLAQTQP